MAAPAAPPLTVVQKLAHANEASWIQVGSVAETMGEHDRALHAYEEALRHNPHSIKALTQAAALCRTREQFSKAVDYFQQILNIDQTNGEIWGALGHCFLMMDDLQRAYTAYQQALYHLPNPKEPKLWYGIGILYDRYGSYEHAEEAFAAVIRMEPKFEKANEIYFRLGIIYKQAGKYETSLSCFKYILTYPPKPLTESDIWFQIGHVFEQQKEYTSAREAYERVLNENPNHAKVLQQLGWLYHQQDPNFANQELAIQYLTRSLEADMNDAQTWYLLGRCYMAQQKYNKAYEAYQQAVYRDGRNPTFWCSIGVLYYQINQYRDALDAYSRAIRLNPYISEVWYDLGTLYESCNNQINDALDAYTRALELDPTNPHIKQRLELLRTAQAGGQPRAGTSQPQPQQPAPRDLKPQSYPSGAGMHSGPTAQFYQGPQPPTQMGYARPGPPDSRPSGAPSEHERLELQPIQGGGPSPYGPPGSLRDDGRQGERQPGLLAEHSGSRSSRPSKSGRGDRPPSPKPSERRGTMPSRTGSRVSGHESTPTISSQPPQLYQSHEDMPGRQMHDIRGPPQNFTSQPPAGHSRPVDVLSRPPDTGSRYAEVGRSADSMPPPSDSHSARGMDSPAGSRGPSSRSYAEIPRLSEMGSRHSEGSPHSAELRSNRPDVGRRPPDLHARGDVAGYPGNKSNDHSERSPYPDRSVESLQRHAEGSLQDIRRRAGDSAPRGADSRVDTPAYRGRGRSPQSAVYESGRVSPTNDQPDSRSGTDRHAGLDSLVTDKSPRSPLEHSEDRDKAARRAPRQSTSGDASPSTPDVDRSGKREGSRQPRSPGTPEARSPAKHQNNDVRNDRPRSAVPAASPDRRQARGDDGEPSATAPTDNVPPSATAAVPSAPSKTHAGSRSPGHSNGEEEEGSSGSPEHDAENVPVDASAAATLVTLGKRPFRRDSLPGAGERSPEAKRTKSLEEGNEERSA
ncbi:hypothetical protein HDU88_000364 [Geranomyces variabilis]|nr:hypothetical protein HDU88_000364 [Geranomyces variabilis]